MNDLPTLFGQDADLDNPLRATLCFTRYLAEHHGPDLTRADVVEKLRCKLMDTRRGDYTITSSASWAFDEWRSRSVQDFMC